MKKSLNFLSYLPFFPPFKLVNSCVASFPPMMHGGRPSVLSGMTAIQVLPPLPHGPVVLKRGTTLFLLDAWQNWLPNNTRMIPLSVFSFFFTWNGSVTRS